MHLRRATATAQLFSKIGKELELQRDMQGGVRSEVAAGYIGMGEE
jgi:hypothetical protein